MYLVIEKDNISIIKLLLTCNDIDFNLKSEFEEEELRKSKRG